MPKIIGKMFHGVSAGGNVNVEVKETSPAYDDFKYSILFRVGLLGPIYPLFVVNRFSVSLLDVGVLYATFCIVAAFFKTVAGKLADVHGKEIIFFLVL